MSSAGFFGTRQIKNRNIGREIVLPLGWRSGETNVCRSVRTGTGSAKDRRGNSGKRPAAQDDRHEVLELEKEADLLDTGMRRCRYTDGIPIRNLQLVRLVDAASQQQIAGLTNARDCRQALLFGQDVDFCGLMLLFVAQRDIPGIAVQHNDPIAALRQRSAEALLRTIAHDRLASVLGIKIEAAASRRITFVPLQGYMNVPFPLAVVQALLRAAALRPHDQKHAAAQHICQSFSHNRQNIGFIRFSKRTTASRPPSFRNGPFPLPSREGRASSQGRPCPKRYTTFSLRPVSVNLFSLSE